MSLSKNLEETIGFTEEDLNNALEETDNYLSDMADGYTLDDFPGHQDEDFWNREDVDFSLFLGASANANWQIVKLALKTLMEVCE